MPDSPEKLAWHPAFCSAAELEFHENKKDLNFVREYNLNKEPLRVDLLIRKNTGSGTQLKNELGHIMKTFNLIEYKSPSDSMNIDDFYKTIGYAALFKSLGSKVNQIKADDITVSLFREAYPRTLFKTLKAEGYSTEETYPGIYYVSGKLPFSVQIIVIRELTPDNHSFLRILSYKAQTSDIENFITKANLFTEQGDISNAESVLQVSGPANFETYEQIKRRDPVMCDFLKELMKDYVEEELSETTEKLDKANEELGKANEELGKANEELGKANKKLGKANKKLGKANETIKSQRRELEEQKAEIARLRSLNASLQG